MVNTVHYTLNTTSMTGDFVNAAVKYDVYFDVSKGIAYDVELWAPPSPEAANLVLVWHAQVVNLRNQRRYEYDVLKKIYYQTRQTMEVESALYKLQPDLMKFMESGQKVPVQNYVMGGTQYPGYQLYTLTIWYDPVRYLPVRRVNLDRGNAIIDEFTYHAVDKPIPDEIFSLPKPAEAIADFNLYPEPPMLPRFENVSEHPQEGVYVDTLLNEIKRFVILNQWEYGPFATIKLPWLTEMPVTVYRNKSLGGVPPLVVVFDVPGQDKTYFFVSYSYLGYVVTGFTQNPYDLSGYDQLPIKTVVRLEELVPLYAAPSYEKEFVIQNFVKSVQSNDFFINAFDMGGKVFDMIIKNFSFHENEGYLILDVYGKEYWDDANMEAKFNYVVTGRMADAHTTPIIIYAINSLKRLGIYQSIAMPVYRQIPGTEGISSIT